jgi:hypothetical protein
MSDPTYGQSLVQPDDVVSRIDNLIPIDPVHAVPLVWNARNIDLQVLIDARNEIKRLRAGGCARNQGLTQHCAEAAAAHAEIERLRARVEVLELIRRYMGQGVVSWDRAEEKAIDEIDERKARAALEVKP